MNILFVDGLPVAGPKKPAGGASLAESIARLGGRMRKNRPHLMEKSGKSSQERKQVEGMDYRLPTFPVRPQDQEPRSREATGRGKKSSVQAILQQQSMERHSPFPAEMRNGAVHGVSHFQSNPIRRVRHPNQVRNAYGMDSSKQCHVGRFPKKFRQTMGRKEARNQESRPGKEPRPPIDRMVNRVCEPIQGLGETFLDGSHPPMVPESPDHMRRLPSLAEEIEDSLFVSSSPVYSDHIEIGAFIPSSRRPLIRGEELKTEPPLTLPEPQVFSDHGPGNGSRNVACILGKDKIGRISTNGSPLFLPGQQRHGLRGLQKDRRCRSCLDLREFQDSRVSPNDLGRNRSEAGKDLGYPRIMKHSGHLIHEQAVGQGIGKRVEGNKSTKGANPLRNPLSKFFPVARQWQLLEVDPVRAGDSQFVRADAEVLPPLPVAFDREAKNQIAQGPEKGSIAKEAVGFFQNFDSIGEDNAAAGFFLLFPEQSAGAGEEAQLARVRGSFGSIENGLHGLGHFEGNVRPDPDPRKLLGSRFLTRLRQHAPTLGGTKDAQNTDPAPRKMDTVSGIELPDDGTGQIGNDFSRYFQEVVFLGFRKIAPDFSTEKSVPVAPSPMKKPGLAVRPGKTTRGRGPLEGAQTVGPKPAESLHRGHNLVENLPLLGEECPQGRKREGLLFVEAGEHLLHKHTGKIGFGRNLDGPLPSQPQQPPKPEKLISRPLSSTDSPKARGSPSPVGTTDPLKKSRHGIGRFVKHHRIHVSHIDSQLEGAGSYAQRMVAAAETLLRRPPFPEPEIREVNLRNPSKRPLTVCQGKETIALPPAVGKHQDFPVSPEAVQVFEKTDQLIISSEVDQVGLDVPLNGSEEPHRVLAKAEETDNGIHIGNGGGKSDLLYSTPRSTLESIQQAGQVPPPVLV